MPLDQITIAVNGGAPGEPSARTYDEWQAMLAQRQMMRQNMLAFMTR